MSRFEAAESLRFSGRNQFLDYVPPGFRIKAPRTHLAAIGDLTFGIDDIKPFGHRGVIPVHLIVHVVEQYRHLELEIDHAHTGDLGPLVSGRRLGH